MIVRSQRTILGRRGCVALLIFVGLAGSTVRAAERELPIDARAEARLLEIAGSGFELNRTDHFVIAYNTDADTLHDFITRVEATYRGALRLLKADEIDTHEPRHRLEIVFFETPEQFRQFAERLHLDVTGAAGFYHPASNRAFFCNARNAPRVAAATAQIENLRRHAEQQSSGGSRAQTYKQVRRLEIQRDRLIETINLFVVQHEVAHQVFFNTGLHVRGADTPPWVAEGLAMLMETPPSNRGAGFGAVNQYRLLSLRNALAGAGRWKDATAEQFPAACANGSLVPLRQLIGDKSLFKTSGPHVEQRYAQAWSFLFYLQKYRREDLGVYLTVLARRPSDRGYTPQQEVMLFEKTFGPIDDQFRDRWLNCVLKLRVHPPR